ncbi:MAG: hypothetical protein ACRCU5_16190, partial [Rhizobiaceae bacterium]
NVLAFHITQTIFDFNGAPTADNDWAMFSIQNPASETESIDIVFRMVGEGFDYIAADEFDAALSAKRRPTNTIADLALGNLSSYLRRFRCRPVAVDPFGRWQVEAWQYFGSGGGPIQVQITPLKYRGETRPTPERIGNTGFYRFPTTNELIGARLVSQYVVGYSNRIPGDPSAVISGLSGAVTQARATAENANTAAIRAQAGVNALNAVAGSPIPGGNTIILGGKMYINKAVDATAQLPAAVTLPTKQEDVTETWLLANGFERAAGGVIVDEVFTAENDSFFIDKKAPDGADIGFSLSTKRTWFIDANRNWTAAPVVVKDPAPVTEIRTIVGPTPITVYGSGVLI